MTHFWETARMLMAATARSQAVSDTDEYAMPEKEAFMVGTAKRHPLPHL